MARLAYKPIDGPSIDLGQYIPGFQSEIAANWGEHRIPGQRGKLMEDLGDGSLVTNVRLQFVGRTEQDYYTVIPAMAKRRQGTLDHPRRGSRSVVIRRFREEVQYTDRGDATMVDVVFEDQIVERVDAFTNGPSAQAQQVTAQANFADVSAASFRQKVFSRTNLTARMLADLALTAVTASTTAATNYATAAQEAFSLGFYDPAVRAQLLALSPSVQAAEEALRRAGTAADVQDTIINLEVMLYSARQLDAAILANQPVPIEQRVTRSPGQSIYAFVQAHYGKTGRTSNEMRDLASLILRLNPQIRRPSLIPVDTVVVRPA